MGGNAFPDLVVPRMVPQAYQRVKQFALESLSKHHPDATNMPEAPEKMDYGDVDLILELSPSKPFLYKQVALGFGTEHVKPNHPIYSFAVPLQDKYDGLQTFGQVDVQVCSPGYRSWTVFLHGYGDLGSILGVFNYGYGFTSRNDGFYVRIKEQEAQNWSASQVFLSHDPDSVMEFLGLDKHKYAQGFKTEEELFDWAVSSRLFNRKLVEKRGNNSEMQTRMEKRPMFRRFISEYLPNLPDNEVGLEETRDAHTQAALAFFGKQDEFNTRRAKVLVENAEEHAWYIIKTTLLTPLAKLESKRLNEVVRALKRFVAFSDGKPYIHNEPAMDTERQARFAPLVNDADEIDPDIRDWIMGNWEEVKARERQRAKGSRRLEAQQG
ncbi:hypothetical protein E4T39_03063 [Aureobasidium subglaciale]|nr:hypothetical protein E4T39_03063 [Aureobasidium subglaciale]